MIDIQMSGKEGKEVIIENISWEELRNIVNKEMNSAIKEDRTEVLILRLY